MRTGAWGAVPALRRCGEADPILGILALLPAATLGRLDDWDHSRRYPEVMPEIDMTPETIAMRELLEARRDEFRALLVKYCATNPKLFGSIARGTAHAGSDIDILVEMDPEDGNLLMRASGLMEETRALFGRDDVDVFPVQLLKHPISASALVDAVAL